MELVLTLFGVRVLSVRMHCACGEGGDAPEGADLSGGDLGSMVVDAGTTDRYMGFSNGLEVDDRGR